MTRLLRRLRRLREPIYHYASEQTSDQLSWLRFPSNTLHEKKMARRNTTVDSCEYHRQPAVWYCGINRGDRLPPASLLCRGAGRWNVQQFRASGVLTKHGAAAALSATTTIMGYLSLRRMLMSGCLSGCFAVVVDLLCRLLSA
jgi:hypothetical protein